MSAWQSRWTVVRQLVDDVWHGGNLDLLPELYANPFDHDGRLDTVDGLRAWHHSEAQTWADTRHRSSGRCRTAKLSRFCEPHRVLWRAEAVRLVREAGPDVVVMDIRMPGMDGIEATRTITASAGATRVLILATFDDDEYVYAALWAGAGGFLVKDMALEDILGAIRVVAAVTR